MTRIQEATIELAQDLYVALEQAAINHGVALPGTPESVPFNMAAENTQKMYIALATFARSRLLDRNKVEDVVYDSIKRSGATVPPQTSEEICFNISRRLREL